MMAVRYLTVAALVVTALAGPAARAETVPAETRPSKDVILSFVVPGKVETIAVEDGDQVEANEMLVQLDGESERHALALQEAEATNEVQLKAARAQLDQAKVDLAKTQEMAEGGAATQLEVQHAELDVTIAELKVELAEFTLEKEGLKVREMRAKIDRMQLRSPIAGRVERIHVSEGEAVDALKEVVRLVRTDPLWVEADVPVEQARAIRPGDRAEVSFLTADAASQSGKVIYKASTAVGAIPPTLMVRIELPNPDARPAGEPVEVRFASGSAVGQADDPTGRDAAAEAPHGQAAAMGSSGD